jgi:hypothetical protein
MQHGDYVLATKYDDGDPGDGYAVGFYDRQLDYVSGVTRHLVVDGEGKQFRGNGFRRVELIHETEGRWLIQHFPEFKPLEMDVETEEVTGKSVWDWLAECRASHQPSEGL